MKITKTHIWIAVTVLILLVGLAYFFYRKGKKTVSIQTLPSDLPGDVSGGTAVAGASNDQIKLVANGLFTDMDGYNWSGHNYEPYNQAIAFSDTDLVKLYNAFNTLYQADSGQTLKQWIESESYAFADIPQSLLARFAKLNLR